jgi:hypothetical protein
MSKKSTSKRTPREYVNSYLSEITDSEKVETIPYAKLLDMFHCALEEVSSLKVELEKKEFEVGDLEQQVGYLINRNEGLEKIINTTRSHLSKARVISEVYWEMNEERESWEAGVINLLCEVIRWAMDGAYTDEKKLIDDFRKSQDLPF